MGNGAIVKQGLALQIFDGCCMVCVPHWRNIMHLKNIFVENMLLFC